MSIIGSNILAGSSGQAGYNLKNSLRFRASNSARLSRTFGTTGTNNKIQTFSAWVKRGLLSSSTDYRLMGGYDGTSSNSTEINFDNDSLRIEFGGAANNPVITTQVFRDPSAWYHIVIAIDTTQATASNRIKMYVNGNQITAFSTATYPSQNALSQLTSANANNSIGAGWSGFEYFDGYMTEINFVDGTALTPSSFGETDTTTGSWKPKKYTGTYGTNGFYLKFADASAATAAAIGKDSSGNGNNWTPSGISVTAGVTYDAMLDSPMLTSATVANYAVLNPLVDSTTATITNANLSSTGSTTTFANARATFTLSSEKWYWEHTITGTSTLYIGIGLCTEASQKSSASNIRQTGWYNVNNGGSGDISSSANGGAAVSISTTNWATNDIIMVAYDAATGYIWFGRNGTWYPPTTAGSAGNPAAGTNQTISAVSNLIPASWHYNTNAGTAVNFGQRPFSYTPPTGFVALNTYNLPTPTILQGNKYMDATTFTATSGAQSITNTGAFKPDFVWTKARSNAQSNYLVDSVRGGTSLLISNSTGAESISTSPAYISSFNSNGYSSDTATMLTNAYTYVGWQWQAGQGTTSSNTSGSITSTVSANTTAGFSVVTFTAPGGSAQTIGHGLGVAPKWIIIKSRNNVSGWNVYHASIGNTGSLNLQTTGATSTSVDWWNNTNPTPTVWTIGANLNISTWTFVAYCWAEIAGFSKFGSYASNNSADGPFVYTGFRPKFVIVKPSTFADQWMVFDSSRNAYNLTNSVLYPNLANAEANDANNCVDFLSNGFKIRGAGGSVNYLSNTYIYMAFAENPFKNANAR